MSIAPGDYTSGYERIRAGSYTTGQPPLDASPAQLAEREFIVAALALSATPGTNKSIVETRAEPASPSHPSDARDDPHRDQCAKSAFIGRNVRGCVNTSLAIASHTRRRHPRLSPSTLEPAAYPLPHRAPRHRGRRCFAAPV